MAMERRQIMSARKVLVNFCETEITNEENENNPQIVDKYYAFIQNQFQLGFMEKVTSNEIDTTSHYIPHNVVVNPAKTPAKVRVVYDASAKLNNIQKSLNKCL